MTPDTAGHGEHATPPVTAAAVLPLANDANDRTARVLRAEREARQLLARADRLVGQAATARAKAGSWHEKAERLDAQARALERTADDLVAEAESAT